MSAKKNMRIALHWQILISLILAILAGIFLPQLVPYVAWTGDVFIRALKMIILPLILGSIISGIIQIGSSDSLGRIGLKTLSYYFLSSLLAIVTGLILVNLFEPGTGISLKTNETINLPNVEDNSIGNLLIEIIPANLFESMAKGEMLPVIFFALLFGFFIARSAEKHKKILGDFFDALFHVMMKLTLFIIRFTPIGIFGIVIKVVAEQDELIDLAGSLGKYMLVVIAGLAIHSLLSLPLVLRIFGLSARKHLRAMRVPLLTAFSTSSSSATLPLTMESAEHGAGIPNKITGFTLPLGATINMDGTALYELVAAMFIAQAYGIEMTITQQIIAVFTALLASIGAAGIPMAGLVMITIVLTAIGLPLEGVGLILAVDRILDMFRTAVNVWSDSCAAAVIAKSEGETTNIAV